MRIVMEDVKICAVTFAIALFVLLAVLGMAWVLM